MPDKDTIHMDYILAIDQGTHASRAVVFNQQGEVVAHARQKIELLNISSTHIEQDAENILRSVEHVIEQVLDSTDVSIHHAALATQRSTLVAWDKVSGIPLAPAISWQDRRCADELLDVRHQHARIHQLTGLPVSPHYLGGKIRWLLKHNAEVNKARQQNTLMTGPLSSYLLFNLLKEKPYMVDHSNAARSLLFDLHIRDWSDELLQLFGIERELLPRCSPVIHPYGHLHYQNIPISCVCGDQNAAIHAYGIPAADTAIINIGTGAFVLQAQGNSVCVLPNLLTGIASSTDTDTRYLLEGTVNGAGAALSALVADWPDASIESSLPEWLNNIQDPPLYINGVGGLGSPWWHEHIDSRFIPDNQDPALQAVAVIESIVFLLQYNLDQFPQGRLARIQVSGGLSILNGLCQRIADLSRLPVIRMQDTEATARGLAWLSLQTAQPWPQHVAAEQFLPCHNPHLQMRYEQYINELLRITGNSS